MNDRCNRMTPLRPGSGDNAGPQLPKRRSPERDAHTHRLAARRLGLDLGEQRFGLLHLDRSDIGVRPVINISAEIVPLELRLQANAKERQCAI